MGLLDRFRASYREGYWRALARELAREKAVDDFDRLLLDILVVFARLRLDYVVALRPTRKVAYATLIHMVAHVVSSVIGFGAGDPELRAVLEEMGVAVPSGTKRDTI